MAKFQGKREQQGDKYQTDGETNITEIQEDKQTAISRGNCGDESKKGKKEVRDSNATPSKSIVTEVLNEDIQRGNDIEERGQTDKETTNASEKVGKKSLQSRGSQTTENSKRDSDNETLKATETPRNLCNKTIRRIRLEDLEMTWNTPYLEPNGIFVSRYRESQEIAKARVRNGLASKVMGLMRGDYDDNDDDDDDEWGWQSEESEEQLLSAGASSASSEVGLTNEIVFAPKQQIEGKQKKQEEEELEHEAANKIKSKYYEGDEKQRAAYENSDLLYGEQQYDKGQEEEVYEDMYDYYNNVPYEGSVDECTIPECPCAIIRKQGGSINYCSSEVTQAFFAGMLLALGFFILVFFCFNKHIFPAPTGNGKSNTQPKDLDQL